MTRELAEKIVVALAPLRDAAPFAVAREALTLAAAFDAAWRIESEKAAPSPAASPAPYVPKVGDRVRLKTDGSLGIVGPTKVGNIYGVVWDGSKPGEEGNGTASELEYIRLATPAERAAAGLDAPKVDREGLAREIYNASHPVKDRFLPWSELPEYTRECNRAAADAALAYLARATRDGGVA